MRYVSTRNTGDHVRATEAIVRGLSYDGGLFVPENLPSFSPLDIATITPYGYSQRAAYLMSMFLDEFTVDELRGYADAAYSGSKFSGKNPAFLNKVGDDYYLELWHGPTCAFKDMALQMLPHLLTSSMAKMGMEEDVLILTATSGDTGKAALEGFKDVYGTKILVFYPEDGVSEIQKLQMTTQKGKNVAVQSVVGNFDDTQTGVKNIFSDTALREEIQKKGYRFSSANSMNWGRLLPQIVYYVATYCEMIGKRETTLGEEVNFCVPTGNFGNILAAYYAKRIGLPIGKLICASNMNNVLTDFIKTGTYDAKRKFYTTVSPSMDILISSNLERLLFDLSGGNDNEIAGYMKDLAEKGSYSVSGGILRGLHEMFWPDYCNEDETMETIRAVWERDRYLIDTHTAVAKNVLGKYRAATGDNRKTVVVSTANPYKFAPAVLKALGVVCGGDEFECLVELNKLTGMEIPQQISSLNDHEVRFSGSVEKEDMTKSVQEFIVR